MVSYPPPLIFQSSTWQYRISSAPTVNDILKTTNKNQAQEQKQKQKQTERQNQPSRNIHHKVTMHAKCLPVQRFGEKISMLQVRPYMDDLKLTVRYVPPLPPRRSRQPKATPPSCAPPLPRCGCVALRALVYISLVSPTGVRGLLGAPPSHRRLRPAGRESARNSTLPQEA